MALTAAAVGAFSKARPVLAFSKLGPLTGRFPRSAVIHFHLGVLLLWSQELAKARTQLEQAAADEPGSTYAGESKKLLAALATAGTHGGK
jgi:hypothetical protein